MGADGRSGAPDDRQPPWGIFAQDRARLVSEEVSRSRDGHRGAGACSQMAGESRGMPLSGGIDEQRSGAPYASSTGGRLRGPGGFLGTSGPPPGRAGTDSPRLPRLVDELDLTFDFDGNIERQLREADGAAAVSAHALAIELKDEIGEP